MKDITIGMVYEFLVSQGWDVPHSKFDLLQRYIENLKSWNERINLVSRKDVQNLIALHVFPSIWFSYVLRNSNDLKILDLGTGGGFPGIILSILCPQNEYLLLDAIKKKTLFLTEMVEELGLNARIINSRVEMILEDTERYDLIVCRAVADISMLWNWAKPILIPQGILLAMKGDEIQEELHTVSQNYLRKPEIIKPEAAWYNFNSCMKTKILVKMEKNNA